VNVTAPLNDPLHTTWSAGSFTTGVGFTVIVKLCVAPVQVGPEIYFGVTVMVAITGTAPAFNPLNADMFPVPLPAKPIEAVSFVQSY
jgi:hypothetical protein